MAAGVTTLSCIGVAVVVSVTSAIGATFLQQEGTLRPLLVVTLGITVVGSALTFWRHRNPIPLLLTLAAGVWIYWFSFVAVSGMVEGGEHEEYAVTTAGHDAGAHPGLVWAGLAVFLVAQVWDVVRVRSRVGRLPRQHRPRTRAPSRWARAATSSEHTLTIADRRI